METKVQSFNNMRYSAGGIHNRMDPFAPGIPHTRRSRLFLHLFDLINTPTIVYILRGFYIWNFVDGLFALVSLGHTTVFFPITVAEQRQSYDIESLGSMILSALVPPLLIYLVFGISYLPVISHQHVRPFAAYITACMLIGGLWTAISFVRRTTTALIFHVVIAVVRATADDDPLFSQIRGREAVQKAIERLSADPTPENISLIEKLIVRKPSLVEDAFGHAGTTGLLWYHVIMFILSVFILVKIYKFWNVLMVGTFDKVDMAPPQTTVAGTDPATTFTDVTMRNARSTMALDSLAHNETTDRYSNYEDHVRINDEGSTANDRIVDTQHSRKFNTIHTFNLPVPPFQHLYPATVSLPPASTDTCTASTLRQDDPVRDMVLSAFRKSMISAQADVETVTNALRVVDYDTSVKQDAGLVSTFSPMPEPASVKLPERTRKFGGRRGVRGAKALKRQSLFAQPYSYLFWSVLRHPSLLLRFTPEVLAMRTSDMKILVDIHNTKNYHDTSHNHLPWFIPHFAFVTPIILACCLCTCFGNVYDVLGIHGVSFFTKSSTCDSLQLTYAMSPSFSERGLHHVLGQGLQTSVALTAAVLPDNLLANSHMTEVIEIVTISKATVSTGIHIYLTDLLRSLGFARLLPKKCLILLIQLQLYVITCASVICLCSLLVHIGLFVFDLVKVPTPGDILGVTDLVSGTPKPRLREKWIKYKHQIMVRNVTHQTHAHDNDTVAVACTTMHSTETARESSRNFKMLTHSKHTQRTENVANTLVWLYPHQILLLSISVGVLFDVLMQVLLYDSLVFKLVVVNWLDNVYVNIVSHICITALAVIIAYLHYTVLFTVAFRQILKLQLFAFDFHQSIRSTQAISRYNDAGALTNSVPDITVSVRDSFEMREHALLLARQEDRGHITVPLNEAPVLIPVQYVVPQRPVPAGASGNLMNLQYCSTESETLFPPSDHLEQFLGGMASHDPEHHKTNILDSAEQLRTSYIDDSRLLREMIDAGELPPELAEFCNWGQGQPRTQSNVMFADVYSCDQDILPAEDQFCSTYKLDMSYSEPVLEDFLVLMLSVLMSDTVYDAQSEITKALKSCRSSAVRQSITMALDLLLSNHKAAPARELLALTFINKVHEYSDSLPTSADLSSQTNHICALIPDTVAMLYRGTDTRPRPASHLLHEAHAMGMSRYSHMITSVFNGRGVIPSDISDLSYHTFDRAVVQDAADWLIRLTTILPHTLTCGLSYLPERTIFPSLMAITEMLITGEAPMGTFAAGMPALQPILAGEKNGVQQKYGQLVSAAARQRKNLTRYHQNPFSEGSYIANRSYAEIVSGPSDTQAEEPLVIVLPRNNHVVGEEIERPLSQYLLALAAHFMRVASPVQGGEILAQMIRSSNSSQTVESRLVAITPTTDDHHTVATPCALRTKLWPIEAVASAWLIQADRTYLASYTRQNRVVNSVIAEMPLMVKQHVEGSTNLMDVTAPTGLALSGYRLPPNLDTVLACNHVREPEGVPSFTRTSFMAHTFTFHRYPFGAENWVYSPSTALDPAIAAELTHQNRISLQHNNRVANMQLSNAMSRVTFSQNVAQGDNKTVLIPDISGQAADAPPITLSFGSGSGFSVLASERGVVPFTAFPPSQPWYSRQTFAKTIQQILVAYSVHQRLSASMLMLFIYSETGQTDFFIPGRDDVCHNPKCHICSTRRRRRATSYSSVDARRSHDQELPYHEQPVLSCEAASIIRYESNQSSVSAIIDLSHRLNEFMNQRLKKLIQIDPEAPETMAMRFIVSELNYAHQSQLRTFKEMLLADEGLRRLQQAAVDRMKTLRDVPITMFHITVDSSSDMQSDLHLALQCRITLQEIMSSCFLMGGEAELAQFAYFKSISEFTRRPMPTPKGNMPVMPVGIRIAALRSPEQANNHRYINTGLATAVFDAIRGASRPDKPPASSVIAATRFVCENEPSLHSRDPKKDLEISFYGQTSYLRPHLEDFINNFSEWQNHTQQIKVVRYAIIIFSLFSLISFFWVQQSMLGSTGRLKYTHQADTAALAIASTSVFYGNTRIPSLSGWQQASVHPGKNSNTVNNLSSILTFTCRSGKSFMDPTYTTIGDHNMCSLKSGTYSPTVHEYSLLTQPELGGVYFTSQTQVLEWATDVMMDINSIMLRSHIDTVRRGAFGVIRSLSSDNKLSADSQLFAPLLYPVMPELFPPVAFSTSSRFHTASIIAQQDHQTLEEHKLVMNTFAQFALGTGLANGLIADQIHDAMQNMLVFITFMFIANTIIIISLLFVNYVLAIFAKTHISRSVQAWTHVVKDGVIDFMTKKARQRGINLNDYIEEERAYFTHLRVTGNEHRRKPEPMHQFLALTSPDIASHSHTQLPLTTSDTEQPPVIRASVVPFFGNYGRVEQRNSESDMSSNSSDTEESIEPQKPVRAVCVGVASAESRMAATIVSMMARQNCICADQAALIVALVQADAATAAPGAGGPRNYDFHGFSHYSNTGHAHPMLTQMLGHSALRLGHGGLAAELVPSSLVTLMTTNQLPRALVKSLTDLDVTILSNFDVAESRLAKAYSDVVGDSTINQLSTHPSQDCDIEPQPAPRTRAHTVGLRNFVEIRRESSVYERWVGFALTVSILIFIALTVVQMADVVSGVHSLSQRISELAEVMRRMAIISVGGATSIFNTLTYYAKAVLLADSSAPYPDIEPIDVRMSQSVHDLAVSLVQPRATGSGMISVNNISPYSEAMKTANNVMTATLRAIKSFDVNMSSSRTVEVGLDRDVLPSFVRNMLADDGTSTSIPGDFASLFIPAVQLIPVIHMIPGQAHSSDIFMSLVGPSPAASESTAALMAEVERDYMRVNQAAPEAFSFVRTHANTFRRTFGPKAISDLDSVTLHSHSPFGDARADFGAHSWTLRGPDGTIPLREVLKESQTSIAPTTTLDLDEDMHARFSADVITSSEDLVEIYKNAFVAIDSSMRHVISMTAMIGTSARSQLQLVILPLVFLGSLIIVDFILILIHSYRREKQQSENLKRANNRRNMILFILFVVTIPMILSAYLISRSVSHFITDTHIVLNNAMIHTHATPLPDSDSETAQNMFNQQTALGLPTLNISYVPNLLHYTSPAPATVKEFGPGAYLTGMTSARTEYDAVYMSLSAHNLAINVLGPLLQAVAWPTVTGPLDCDLYEPESTCTENEIHEKLIRPRIVSQDMINQSYVAFLKVRNMAAMHIAGRNASARQVLDVLDLHDENIFDGKTIVYHSYDWTAALGSETPAVEFYDRWPIMDAGIPPCLQYATETDYEEAMRASVHRVEGISTGFMHDQYHIADSTHYAFRSLFTGDVSPMVASTCASNSVIGFLFAADHIFNMIRLTLTIASLDEPVLRYTFPPNWFMPDFDYQTDWRVHHICPWPVISEMPETLPITNSGIHCEQGDKEMTPMWTTLEDMKKLTREERRSMLSSIITSANFSKSLHTFKTISSLAFIRSTPVRASSFEAMSCDVTTFACRLSRSLSGLVGPWTDSMMSLKHLFIPAPTPPALAETVLDRQIVATLKNTGGRVSSASSRSVGFTQPIDLLENFPETHIRISFYIYIVTVIIGFGLLTIVSIQMTCRVIQFVIYDGVLRTPPPHSHSFTRCRPSIQAFFGIIISILVLTWVGRAVITVVMPISVEVAMDSLLRDSYVKPTANIADITRHLIMMSPLLIMTYHQPYADYLVSAASPIISSSVALQMAYLSRMPSESFVSTSLPLLLPGTSQWLCKTTVPPLLDSVDPFSTRVTWRRYEGVGVSAKSLFTASGLQINNHVALSTVAPLMVANWFDTTVDSHRLSVGGSWRRPKIRPTQSLTPSENELLIHGSSLGAPWLSGYWAPVSVFQRGRMGMPVMWPVMNSLLRTMVPENTFKYSIMWFIMISFVFISGVFIVALLFKVRKVAPTLLLTNLITTATPLKTPN